MKQNNSLIVFSIVTLIIATTTRLINATNFCDLCKCFVDETANATVVQCDGALNRKSIVTAHEMQYFEWPDTNRVILAKFNHLNFTVLPRLQGHPAVTRLNFDNNLIRTIGPKPFQYFEQLDEISIQNNFITELPKDFLYRVKRLEYLHLSNNSITKVSPDVLSGLNKIQIVDLSHNKLTAVSEELQKAFQVAHTIRLAHNDIFTITAPIPGQTEEVTAWQDLDLSYNALKYLPANVFSGFPRLLRLDVSHNSLINIDDTTFKPLDKLHVLDLTGNELQNVALLLPDSIEVLKLGNNSIRLWPLQTTPKNLEYFDLHGNEMSEIFPGHETVQNLKTFNVSRNLIDRFPEIQFTHLSSLDLSYNLFEDIPAELATYAPLLEELVMDNNPINMIRFGDKLRLSKLSLKNMPMITSIDAFTFTNVEGAKVRKDKSSTCIDIYVSHCDKLEEVHSDAFSGAHLCYLDLSYNKIKKLPNNLTEWQQVEDGINLQGNPFHCDCDSQWMLDKVLVELYKTEQHQRFLADLRCSKGSHPYLENQRLVRFYNQTNAFCNPESISLRRIANLEDGTSADTDPEASVVQLGNVRIRLTSGMPTYMIIIIVSAIVLALIIVSGIHLTRVQTRKMLAKNRRFAT